MAIKLEDDLTKQSLLKYGVDLYQRLQNGIGIPNVYWHSSECECNVTVFNLLGPSLEDLLNYRNRQFSPRTVLILVDQLLARLQFIHAKEVVHRIPSQRNS